MRTSEPFTEVSVLYPVKDERGKLLVDGVWPGERVERDDGWWRAVRVNIRTPDPGELWDPWAYVQTVEWVPE